MICLILNDNNGGNNLNDGDADADDNGNEGDGVGDAFGDKGHGRGRGHGVDDYHGLGHSDNYCVRHGDCYDGGPTIPTTIVMVMM